MAVVFWIVVIAGVYITPTVVACLRHVVQWDAVAVINLLLGWTGLGWAAAMAMAACMKTRPRPAAAASPYQPAGARR